MSVLFTLCLWLIAHFSDSLREISHLYQSAFLSHLSNLLYWLLPDLASLTRVRNLLMYDTLDNHEVISYLSCYIFGYILILLVMASLVTEEREFS